ncbi:MAG: tRNA (adenosine(37)-N6)-dimethylallyltransferase MiaA [Pirellulaceae bacterium]
MSSPSATDCWFLTGPTAAGKTKVGLELAERIGAEIVSLDSMTLYVGMDIGTAKPTAEDRARVPHHLLDLVPPTDDFSLAEYLDAAHEKINDIKGRGKKVLFVGGTALYLKSLLRGVYQGPPPDWEFREAIEKELEVVGLEELHKRLQVIDPLLAAKLHPNDKRRIIRALEVFRVTGEPLSHRQTHFDEGRTASQCKVFVLSWPREEIHQRIDARVDAMFAAGLVEEVRGLLASYGSLSRTASQAVGYREVMDHLAGPATPSNSLAACIELVKARTRQFARRQETWFRGLPECTFVPQSADKSPAEIAANILHLLESQPTSS